MTATVAGMDRKRRLRVALAGTGFAGASHARAIRLAGAELVGVAASTADRGREAAARLGAPRYYDSLEQMAAADDIDVVHVCLPNSLHASVAVSCLQSGKHVICEKPLALDGSSADTVVGAWRRAGTIGVVPFVYRYYPMVRELRARVAAGELGALHLIHGSYLQDWLASAGDTNWRVDPAVGGPSRAFADIGSHWCDLAEFVTGQRIRRVSARTATAFETRPYPDGRPTFGTGANDHLPALANQVGTEDVVLMHFETDMGVLGAMVISQVSPGRKNALTLEISGTTGTGYFSQERPESIWIGRRDGATAPAAEPASLVPDAARLAVLPAGHPQGWLDCVSGLVADAYAAIADEAPEGLPTFDDGQRAVAITEAVLRSADHDGQWTEVGVEVLA
jgi:predicted dehydrogenase